jgi:hypothetical protein
MEGPTHDTGDRRFHSGPWPQDYFVFGTERQLAGVAAECILKTSFLHFQDRQLWIAQRDAIRSLCGRFFRRHPSLPCLLWTTPAWYATAVELLRIGGTISEEREVEAHDNPPLVRFLRSYPEPLDVRLDGYDQAVGRKKNATSLFLGYQYAGWRDDFQLQYQYRIRKWQTAGGLELSSLHEVYSLGTREDHLELKKTGWHRMRPGLRIQGAKSVCTVHNTVSLARLHPPLKWHVGDAWVDCVTLSIDPADARVCAVNRSVTDFLMFALQHPWLRHFLGRIGDL